MLHPSTFSIVACDTDTSEVGVAVQSKFLSVGSAVPWAIGGVGAIATQAWANTTYGPRGLALLQEGKAPEEVIDWLTSSDEHRDERQLGIVDATGRSATYTGVHCMDWAGGIAGANFAAQGNILAGKGVVDGLASAFQQTRGYLADRLIAALRAGQAAGGDRRGKQSAALYIAKPGGGYAGFNDRYVDLRVDDHPDPIEELARILELHKLYFFKAEPHDVLTIDASLKNEIDSLVARAGAKSLVEFMHRENLENRVRDDDTVDKQTLGYLRDFVKR
ncbi:MAG TPA: DUF1028 domain-containing protein [Candidatus Eremiobacteraceae bacterium]|nr:DUF1028 domain-containing protein [Candidatus Eremiobacteraceae bacterium]